VTGGSLNAKKCCAITYTWTPDTFGILKLDNPDLTELSLNLEDNQNLNPITILQKHAGTRYLGLYVTGDRNTKPMEANLWQKAVTYTNAFQRTPMSRREANVLYRSCFLPALSYPLPATWLPDMFFDKIHRLSTSVILNKMGYHHSLPRCLVFAPRAIGGIGLCHLQHEMEAQQILLLLRHLCTQTPLGKAIDILIRYYQLWAGLENSILHDTRHCSWIPDCWLSSICRTLRENQIQILHDIWLPPPIHLHDRYLMDAFLQFDLPPAQLWQLNACRMYLHVTTLAEITDHTGMYLLPQAFPETNFQS